MWDSMDFKTPFWVTTIHPLYEHMCPHMWNPHFRLRYGSDTISNDPSNYVDIIRFGAHTPHGFVLSRI